MVRNRRPLPSPSAAASRRITCIVEHWPPRPAHGKMAWLARGSGPRVREARPSHSPRISTVNARPLLAVFGSSTIQPGDAAYALALELGREAARAGADVMTGGYSGAMEACSSGAHEAGRHVVGVTLELFERRGLAEAVCTERVN